MHGTTVLLDTAKQQSMARLEALARLMDGAFVLPGTTIRFGLDGIIGLIPVAGDMIAGSGLDLPRLGSSSAWRANVVDRPDAGKCLPRHCNRLRPRCGRRF